MGAATSTRDPRYRTMAGVVYRLAAEARTRWRAWLTVAILAGLVGGATIAALAGARRTETAYTRFLEGTRSFDVMVTNGGTTADNINRQFDFDELGQSSLVADTAEITYYFPTGTTAAGRPLARSDLTPFASRDGRFGTELNAARVLDGRLPTGEHEIAITPLAAERLGVDVGQTMHLHLAGPEAIEQLAGTNPSGADHTNDGTEEFEIVGNVAVQGGLPPATGGIPPLVLLSPTYAQSHPHGSQLLAVRLAAGPAGIDEFQRELRRLAGGEQVASLTRTELASAVERGVAVQTTALRVLGLLVAAVAVLLIGHALVRQAAEDTGDHATLRAVGATPSQVRILALGRGLLIATVAAIVAACSAVVLSPLAPVGAARLAELDAGLDVNGVYVGVGTVVVLLLVAALSAVSTGSATARRVAPTLRGRPPSWSIRALARAGFPVPAVCGVRMALDVSRAVDAVPVRTTIASAVIGIGTVTAVLCFSSSLGRLFREPQLYGWSWDIQVGDIFSPGLLDEGERLSAHPATAAVAIGTIDRLEIGSLAVDTLAIEPLKGALEPTVLEGRAPTEPTEIVLGTRTLDSLDLSVGDTVTVGSGGRTSRMRIVGRAVLTEFAGAARLGDGAALTLDGMRRVVRDAVVDVVLIRLEPGAAGEALRSELVSSPIGNVYLPEQPSDLANIERVGGFPSIVAAIIGSASMATVAHALISSVRRRRRDLAILRVLGLTRHQTSATVAWQATAITSIAVVIGLPLGIGAGRWAWQVFAGRLGAPTAPDTPGVALAILAVAALVLSNLTAAMPARAASRTRTAMTLRTE